MMPIEPIFQRNSDFPQIILQQHIFIPHEQFNGTEFVREGEVDGKIKRSIFRGVGWVDGAFTTGVWKRVLRTDTTTNLWVDREYRTGDGAGYEKRRKATADVEHGTDDEKGMAK